MTVRNLYEGVLIELHKENAPNILLEDFNYFANKAINNYINKRYNIYDINQQTTDDLRVLKATALLTPTQANQYKGMTMAGDENMATYEVTMPSDYLHILNCICIYKVNKTYKCYNAGDTWRAAATRLTADAYSQVLDNFWNKPTYKRPYYYIHNVNTSVTVPTNPVKGAGYLKGIFLGRITDDNIIIAYKDGSYYVFKKNDDYLCFDEVGNFDFCGNYTDTDNLEVLEASCKLGTSTASSTNPEAYLFYLSESEKGTLVKCGPNIEKYDSFVNFKENVENFIEQGYVGTDVPYLTTENPNGTAEFGLGSYLLPKLKYGTDAAGNDIVQGEGFPRYIISNGQAISNVERGQAIRYGNVSLVRLEIRYGTDNSVFQLHKVYVDYIKAPQNIRLTQREIDLTEDTSQMLEYPDYVCQEIINELVHLVMENISDLRLQTHPVVSLSIANPTQALTPAAEG